MYKEHLNTVAVFTLKSFLFTKNIYGLLFLVGLPMFQDITSYLSVLVLHLHVSSATKILD